MPLFKSLICFDSKIRNMHIKTFIINLFVIFCLGISGTVAEAAEKFKISIGIHHQGQFVKPIGNVINLPDPRTPFVVFIKNISSDSQKLYAKNYGTGSDDGLSAIFFEVYDERGQKNTIKKKVRITRSNVSQYQYIRPGEVRQYLIRLDDDEWDNAFKFYKQGARKGKARAIFHNGTRQIKSDFYEVYVE